MSPDKKNPSTGSGRDRDDNQEPEATTASGTPESSEETTTDAPAEEVVVEADEVVDVPVETESLSEEDAALLDLAAVDLVSEMRSDMLRAQAELVNFRTRVERDRVANRESVIAEVIRSLLPAIDDLTRAEKHGDLEGSPLELVAAKIRSAFERYGLRSVGEKGEVFDPHFHEAVVQLPTPGATEQTVADVIDPGYALGERLIRAAKVAVSVPE
ncbi:molecular chaperone GrpE [Conyzicola lurida]|uniref:Protein GrpE n=1 Tax=Conyzicola lurida TaxID=1172621 RepID=A0A841APA5_9MICO|nr:nucleotide exchange factor GrpE [Conyzicola lurida]MBB5845027.1 molecular chaperone GrpE [Conyzicola lurida]